jgi:hypothetical protein
VGAVLTITNLALTDAKDGEAAIVNVQVEMDDETGESTIFKTFTLCKLISGKVDSNRVEIKLFSHEESKIHVKGSGEVHITGYLEPDRTFDGILEQRLPFA